MIQTIWRTITPIYGSNGKHIILNDITAFISLPQDSQLSQQILFCTGIMIKNSADNQAMFQFLTVTASVKSFFIYTFSNYAIITAIRKFHSVHTATHTIYGRCSNLRSMIHGTPLLGRFFSQLIVICNSSDAGFTIFAI